MKQLRYLFCWLLALLIAPAATAVSVVNFGSAELEERLERRVQQLVRDFVGPAMRSAVSVRTRPADAAQRSPASAAVDSRLPLLGYVVTVPPSSEGDSAAVSLSLEAVEISVELEAIASADLRRDLKGFLEAALRDYSPQVKISARLPAAAAPASAAERGPASENAGTESAPETLMQKLLAWAQPLGLLVLALATILAGVLLSSSLGQVAEGIKTIRPPTLSNSADKPLHVAGFGAEAGSPAVASSEAEVKRYLDGIEHAVNEAPLLLLRALGNEESDLRGLRFLLALLSAEAKETLCGLMGADRLASLEALEEDASFDGHTWLKSFAERVQVRIASGGSALDRVLSPDEAIYLSRLDGDRILDAADELNEEAALRVAVELASSESISRRGAKLDASFWTRVAEGAQLDDESLKRSASSLVSRLRQDEQLHEAVSPEVEAFFNAKLLPAVVASMDNLWPGEDDAFVDELSAQNPQLARRIRSFVWTPRSLARVEDTSLAQAFAGFPNDQKALILRGMPDYAADRLKSFIPEGMARTIVNDTLARLPPDVDEARTKCKQFLSYLKTQADQGRLQLRSGGDASDSGVPEAA